MTSIWNGSRITTVGELLAALSDIPLETPVLSSFDDGTLDDIFFEFHEKDGGSTAPEFIVLNTPPELTLMTPEEQRQQIEKWNKDINSKDSK